ncbi:MAG: pilus assembly FimT family protein [Thermoguttaceae bacterium]
MKVKEVKIIIFIIMALCLLVVLAAMSWPALYKSFNNHRLLRAADQIRIQCCKARIKAISTGRTLALRYEINGSKYRLDDQTALVASSQAENILDPLANDPIQLILSKNSISAGNKALSTDPLLFSCLTLPQDVFFIDYEKQINNNAMDNNAEAIDNAMINSMASAEPGWSLPILFYPDGTTSTAHLFLRNTQNRTIELYLRGLTGVLRVGDITVAQEPSP